RRIGSPPSRKTTAAGARAGPDANEPIAAATTPPPPAPRERGGRAAPMRAVDGLTDGVGAARPHGRGRDRSSSGRARHRLPRGGARRRRLLERAALHRDRFSARVLSALPRLFEILSAVGNGALPQSQARQYARGDVRYVT